MTVFTGVLKSQPLVEAVIVMVISHWPLVCLTLTTDCDRFHRDAEISPLG